MTPGRRWCRSWRGSPTAVGVDLFALATDLLDRVVVSFAVAGVVLPPTRYVAPGDAATVAYDTEAVLVTVDWVGPGQPGADRAGVPWVPSGGLRYAQLSVTVLRAAAVVDGSGDPPPPDAISADAQVQVTDLLVLAEALEAVRDSARTTGGWVGAGAPVALGRVRPVGPQGTLMGVTGSVQAVLS